MSKLGYESDTPILTIRTIANLRDWIFQSCHRYPLMLRRVHLKSQLDEAPLSPFLRDKVIHQL